jgi:hypothetical protein
MHRLDAQTEDALAFQKLTPVILNQHTDFSCSEGLQGILAEVRPVVLFRRSDRMEENPHHGSSHPFICMGQG